MVSFLSSAQWLRPKKINYSNLFHENLINGKQVSLWNKNNKQKKYIYFKILVWNLVWILHFLSVFLFPSFFQLTFTFRGIWWHFEKRRKVRCFFRHGCVQQHFFFSRNSQKHFVKCLQKNSPPIIINWGKINLHQLFHYNARLSHIIPNEVDTLWELCHKRLPNF